MPKIERRPNGMPTWIDVQTGSVEDREALMKFLGDLFGWTFAVGSPETGYYTMASMSGNEICAIGQQEGAKSRWVVHLMTDDVEATVARAAELGANVFFPPMPVMRAGTLAMAVDPCGAVVGFWQPDLFNGFHAMHEAGMPTWFDHESQNPRKALEFYQSLFPAIEFDEYSPAGNGVMRIGEESFASLTYHPEHPPVWNPVYAVESMSATAAKARELGAKINFEDMVVPGGLAADFCDPAVGSSITVFQPTAS